MSIDETSRAIKVTSIIQKLTDLVKNDTFWQLLRFLVAGGLTTLLYALAYSILAGTKTTSEQVANLIGYLLAMASGYVLHSRWSFQGHGGAAKQTSWRFVVVSLISFGMNTAWVWVLTSHAMFAGPWWWPLLPVVFVTPLINFWLNRTWVFT